MNDKNIRESTSLMIICPEKGNYIKVKHAYHDL